MGFARGKLYADSVGASAKPVEAFFQKFVVARVALGCRQLEVAVLQYVAFAVGKEYGYGCVALYYAQKEVDVSASGIACAGRGRYYLLGGVGPYFHSFALLRGEVADQSV